MNRGVVARPPYPRAAQDHVEDAQGSDLRRVERPRVDLYASSAVELAALLTQAVP
jgi:hypothetical protein